MASPSLLVQLAIGAAVVIAVVGTLIWLGKKGFFEPDSTNTDGQEEREEIAEAAGSQDFRIPLRRRVGAWSAPYKVFVGSLVALGVVGGAITYQMFKTGSPVGSYIPPWARYCAIALIGVVGGVRLHRWFDSQLGYLNIVYERTGQPNIVERIPFVKTGVQRRDGKVTVPEVADNRLLGLFWRYRQVGEDRRLRGGDKPLDDVITHKVPDHGDEYPDGEGFIVTTREDGDRVLSGATSTADVTYSSPNSLSDERATQLREKMNRKETQLRGVQASNAEYSQQIKRMRKKIENEEYQDREELMGDLEEFSDMLSTLKVQIDDNSSGPKENGSSQEAGA